MACNSVEDSKVGIDLSALFNQMICTNEYPDFETFQTDLMKFQRETATCYEICWTRTASQWFKQKQIRIPAKYKYVKFACIHARKRKQATAIGRRFTELGCPSTFIMKFSGGFYSVSSSNMQHTHVPSTDHPWVYPKNRRLSKDELQKVHTLMENCTSLDNVREYVSLSYGISLTRSDIWNLRRVKKTVQPLPNSSQSSEHSTNRKVEPVGIKQIEHLFTESPMAIIPNTSDFSSTAPSETPSITHQVNARYKATPIKRTPQSQTEYLARRNSLIGSPAPSKPTDCLQQFRIPIRISNTIAKHATTVPLFPPTASRGPAIALPSISNATSSDPMFKPLNKRVILKVIPRSVLTSNPSANSPGSLRNTNPMLFNALRNCGPGSAKPDVG